MTSSLLKTSLSQLRSRVSQLFGKPPQLASLGRVTSYPVREEPDYHRAGGFHPIRLGDTFHHGQYTILRKLGYGQYSTVWLAKDAKCAVRRRGTVYTVLTDQIGTRGL